MTHRGSFVAVLIAHEKCNIIINSAIYIIMMCTFIFSSVFLQRNIHFIYNKLHAFKIENKK